MHVCKLIAKPLEEIKTARVRTANVWLTKIPAVSVHSGCCFWTFILRNDLWSRASAHRCKPRLRARTIPSHHLICSQSQRCAVGTHGATGNMKRSGAEIRTPCPGDPSHLAEISLYDFISRCAGSSVIEWDIFMERLEETGSLPHLPRPSMNSENPSCFLQPYG